MQIGQGYDTISESSASTYSDMTAQAICCEDERPVEKRVEFMPGRKLGIFGDWGSGMVTEVEEDGQAAERGVKRGWMMKLIGEAGGDREDFQ
eukprot:CAMPEP_0172920066 /NCGR_PEP_ID=MMETSP1075-20121228/203337_1 /TAXON_ID=2916 /ORGANISM="Ceratium fusus, Strain PA161109" /LENGTH=91 /DNA_ID=CAMNT_0013780021 /DNA_START=81 /DNA_END=353 /DNA_ORIENTATION=-